jgi:hypothetical protein
LNQLILILGHQDAVDLYFRRGKGRCSNEFERSVTINVNALVPVND